MVKYKVAALFGGLTLLLASCLQAETQAIRFLGGEDDADNAQQQRTGANGDLQSSIQSLEQQLNEQPKEGEKQKKGEEHTQNSKQEDDQVKGPKVEPTQQVQQAKEESGNTNKTQEVTEKEEGQKIKPQEQQPTQNLAEAEAAAEKTDPAKVDNTSLTSILNTTGTDEIVDKFITRKDGLNNLLYSDVNALLTRVNKEFPDITKLYSIGRSAEGRDINVIELETGRAASNNRQSLSESTADYTGGTEYIQLSEGAESSADQIKPAILLTGATHARELISTTMVLYELLKLIQLGHVKKEQKYQQLLQQNKYLFMPIFNVDGVALIEKNWLAHKKILPKRKNNNNQYGCVSDADMGVDLNRNFAVDFGQIDDIVNFQGDLYKVDDTSGRPNDGKAQYKNPCFTNFAGPNAFSEAETQAFKSFLTSNQEQLAFIINIHSNGNAFIYPFNGRQKNDIEERRPGILPIFLEISKEAPFPQGTMKGTSKEVMGLALGGDQDDWALAELGIPSVTAELGYAGQFIDEWQLVDPSTGNNICSEQSEWMEYVMTRLPQYHQMVSSSRQQVASKSQKK